MEYDLHNSVVQAMAIPVTTLSTNTTLVGIIIDTLTFESIEFIALSRSTTDGDYDFSIEQGSVDDLSDAEQVPPELIIGTLPVYDDAEDNVVKRVGVVGKKRYVRMSVTSSNVSSGGTFGAIAILGNAHARPTPEQL